MIIPMNVAVTQVQIPMDASADTQINMGIDAQYNPGSGGGYPSGGQTGDILAKHSDEDNDVEWIAPATSLEQGSTRPITADAVYDIIDDTAGDGDTDKVWSADKIVEELSTKAPSNIINDSSTSGQRTWSAYKTNNEIQRRKIHRFEYTLNANNRDFELMWSGTVQFSSNVFTDDFRVVGYMAEHPEYLKDFKYTINPNSFVPSAKVMPGAPSQKIELYVAETGWGMG